MALPILDGNQSATTLSTILAGGEHTPAHTVVSLGSTAISNITSAISGSVVSISNFPASQTIAGTVTANGGNFAGEDDDEAPPQKGVQLGFFNSANLYKRVGAFDRLPVDVGNSVTIGSLPAINGTVTAGNLPVITRNDVDPIELGIPVAWYDDGSDARRIASENTPFPVKVIDAGNPLPISGAVTANVGNNLTDFGEGLAAGFSSYGGISVVALDQQNGGTLSISGTVTVGAVPNGSLTTRFGTPTTASVAFATTAVTNANRKYLLIQNVTTGSNVITVGIGFTPTTTQGIQLVAGAGITFESSYIPTGAVRILSSVTASNFTILEA